MTIADKTKARFLFALFLSPSICPFQARAESGAVPGCIPNSAAKSFTERFVNTYADALKWNGDPAETPSNWRKDLPPPPESAPPLPFTNWPIGGTENIGYENIYYGPLMDAIYCGPNGQAWKDSRVTFYGWAEPGMNLSTSKSNYNYSSGTGGNYPAAYSYRPNTVQIDQLVLYAERTPDEVQKDHVEWGFRTSLLFGSDYRYTFARGILSDQFTQTGSEYGFDLPMVYGELYIPQVADGMNIRFGRYISLPDIEAQLAPNNYTYSHSLLYTYDPYTQTGVAATVKLNKNWTIQGELTGGNDVALWYRDSDSSSGRPLGAQWTPAACLSWTSDSADDNLYGCYNGFHPIAGNSGNFGWNNLQQEVITWFHKVDERWHLAFEFWYMYENNTPNVNNPAGQAMLNADFSNLKYGAPFGAQCANSSQVTCKSEEYAFVNYITYQWTPRDFVTFRIDYLDDQQGQRTGFATKYTEVLLGWNHWIGKAITIRPELRYEHAGVAAYDNPTGTLTSGSGNTSQCMVAMDGVFHF